MSQSHMIGLLSCGWPQCHDARQEGEPLSRNISGETQRILQIEDARQRRLEIAVQASGIGVFEFDPATEEAFWDDRVSELWGVAPGTAITYDTVINAVHVDDRDLHDSSTAASLDPDGDGRMDMTYRVIPCDGTPMKWIRAVANCSFDGDTPIRLVGTVQDVTTEQMHQERTSNLLHELEHRVKNTLAVAGAVIDLSRSGHTSVDTYAEVVAARLRSMARSHDSLRRTDWTDVPLEALARDEATSFITSTSPQFELTGAPVSIPSNNVLTFSMALHELFTNAAKHGALTTPDGRIVLSSRIDGDIATLTWTETGGPAYASGAGNVGFGTLLLEKILTTELNATFTRLSTENGVVCTIQFPKARTVA